MKHLADLFDGSWPGREPVEIGTLHLPTASVLCCDPFGHSHPLNAAPGEYPVKVWVIDDETWGPRVAFAALVLSDHVPESFFEAIYRIEPRSTGLGFQVESGLACFMDATTAADFRASVASYNSTGPAQSYYERYLAREFERSAENGRKSGNWAVHHPFDGDPRNIIMFSSGLGDGYYDAYWGDVADPALPLPCLIADFQLYDGQAKASTDGAR